MASHSMKPITPLGGDQARIDQFDDVTISENVGCALASIAQRVGKGKPFNAATKKAFKLGLPSPGKLASKGDLTLFWTGQEQWFVEASLKTHEDIATILIKDFKESASITEQTGGWCRFDVSGDGAVSVLERLCPVDTASMDKDAATRSVIEHIGVFVLCREAGTEFSIYGPRSSAGSLHHALTGAAKSAL